MGSTFSRILLHIVFSTKDRRPYLSEEPREHLFRYLSGMIKERDGRLLTGGGMPDHVHLLVLWNRNESVANLMRDTKSTTSRWLKKEYPKLAEFAWQRGYGAFSVSKSQVNKVSAYIRNQAEHHERLSYQEEFKRILRAHKLEFDERYMWE